MLNSLPSDDSVFNNVEDRALSKKQPQSVKPKDTQTRHTAAHLMRSNMYVNKSVE